MGSSFPHDPVHRARRSSPITTPPPRPPPPAASSERTTLATSRSRPSVNAIESVYAEAHFEALPETNDGTTEPQDRDPVATRGDSQSLSTDDEMPPLPPLPPPSSSAAEDALLPLPPVEMLEDSQNSELYISASTQSHGVTDHDVVVVGEDMGSEAPAI